MRECVTGISLLKVASLIRRTVVTRDGCWVWTGGVDRVGKPRHDRGRVLRTLYCYEYDVDLEEGEEVLCVCGEKLCVNPAHAEVR